MKKTLSIVLALALALAMFSSFALISTTANADMPKQFQLKSIMVSDAAGYANPYMAVDNAALFVENQAAYVVVNFVQYGPDVDAYNVTLGGPFVVEITSITLDLAYMDNTDKAQAKFVDDSTSGTFIATVPVDGSGSAYGTIAFTKATSTKADFITVTPMAAMAIDDVLNVSYAFIAVTKPATAGIVTASMKVSATMFSATATSASLPVYENGVLKYTIVRTAAVSANGNNFEVYAGEILPATEDPLFTYMQGLNTAGLVKFLGIAYENPTAPDTSWTHDGKLLFLGDDGVLGGTGDNADVDLTATVNAVNAYFGFSFAYDVAVKDTNFEAKTIGNPIVVSDTYAMFSAVVTDGDGVDIAPTGDFSANIVIVMAASAVLAAAALAFVAKKARD